MRSLLARIVIAAVAVLLVLGRYGTLAPCGMLRAEVERRVLAGIVERSADAQPDAYATSYRLATLDEMLRETTRERPASECLGALLRLHTDREVADLLESGGLRAGLPSSRSPSDERKD